MNIYLFNFTKRENSTKQPALSGGTVYSCTLKKGCSIVNPIVYIEGSITAYTKYNYAYISDFGRYYFVDDVTSDGYVWIYSLSTDVLATYKSTIGNTDLYVLRSAYESDGSIIDTYYPGKASYTVDGRSSVNYLNGTTPAKSSPWTTTVSSGCFILGMQSIDANMGSIKYIAMNSSNMQSLCQTLATDAITTQNLFDFTNISQALTKQICDPLQYIKSAMWVPIPYSTFDSISASTTLNTGYLSFSGFSYKDISGYFWIGDLLAYELANHPQIARGVYLNDKPFTERYMFMPPFGCISLNNNNIVGYNYIAANWRLDLITGMGDVALLPTDDPQLNNVHLAENIITRVSAQVGVPVIMTQAVSDYTGMIGSIGAAITGASVGDVAMVAAGIGSTVQAMQPRITSIGGTGGIGGLAGTWRIHSIFTAVPAEHLEDIGRPLCKVRKPSAVPGFIMARSGDVPINGTSGEQAQIQEYLQAGFFYE